MVAALRRCLNRFKHQYTVTTFMPLREQKRERPSVRTKRVNRRADPARQTVFEVGSWRVKSAVALRPEAEIVWVIQRRRVELREAVWCRDRAA